VAQLEKRHDPGPHGLGGFEPVKQPVSSHSMPHAARLQTRLARCQRAATWPPDSPNGAAHTDLRSAHGGIRYPRRQMRLPSSGGEAKGTCL